MARFQIEPSIDSDDTLPGGRLTVHRWSFILEPGDLEKLQAGEAVKVSAAVPNATVRHLFAEVKTGPEADRG